MRSLLRIGIGLIVGAGTCVLVQWYAPELPGAVESVIEDTPQPERAEAQTSHQGELQESRGRTARFFARQGVVDELIAGHMPLRNAAALFQELDKLPPVPHRKTFENAFPGSTEMERYERQVVSFAELTLRDRPQQRSEILARLKAELPSSSDEQSP